MLVTTQQELQDLIEQLNTNQYIALDTETDGLSPYQGNRIIGISFGIPTAGVVRTWYVPFRHLRGHLLNFKREDFWKLCTVFSDASKVWITWNGKFDLHFLHVDGVEVLGQVQDAMLGWHLADENEYSYALKTLAKSKLSWESVKDDKILQILLRSEKMDKGDMANLSPLEATLYAENDVNLTWRMYVLAIQELKRQGLVPLYDEICDFARVMERVERKGIKVDPEKAEQLIKSATTREEELLEQLRGMAWSDFNPGSYTQCQEWLGLKSTRKEFLLELEEVPGVAELLEYRGHSKALGTFYNPWKDRQDRFHRVHPDYRVGMTVTGRMACAKPNVQQIPRTSSQWAKVKDMIVASTGNVLLSSDLSQAEYRLLAHYSEDPFLVNAYRRGELDIHQMVADQMGIDRHAGKTLNFSKIYGGGIPTVTRQLRCSVEEAQDFIRSYDRRFPSIRKLFYHMKDVADQIGYVQMWTGRRRRFPKGRGEGTQKALNAVIQGGVAEIVRIAMTNIDRQLPENAWMIAHIHDEILIECKKSLLSEVAELSRTALTTAGCFRVPFVSDQKVGTSWGNMKPLKEN